MHPPDDDFAARLLRGSEAVLGAGIDEGRRVIEPMAMKPSKTKPRPTLPVPLVASTFKRDHFRCRYCGCETISPSVLRVFSSLFPEQFPYHLHWKIDSTHPAFLSRSSSCDHVFPGTHRESWEKFENPWTDRDNLVTACWLCNARKSDLSVAQLGWNVRPIVDTGWDGLTSKYEALWKAAGEPEPYLHQDWMTEFNRR